MIIANPIYDVVFKYLLEDNRIARLFIGKIIGEEIEELTSVTTEQVVPLEKRNLTILRLDFNAKIKSVDGTYKTVLIELQKAKFHTDIMRFRKYLGHEYSSDHNTISSETEKSGIPYLKPIPIITIYFLGHPLDHITVPFIRVAREYRNGITGEILTEREHFIESLTHDCFIIQIPALKDSPRKTDLELLLSLFDQNQELDDVHILSIDETQFPEEYRDVLRRLQKACETKVVRNTMDAEDDIIEELNNMERAIAKRDETIAKKDEALAEKDEALAEKDEALAEKDEALAEKDEALAEKDEALAEKDEALAEKDEALAEKDRFITEMKKQLELLKSSER